jgi:hypothetical protein
MRLLPPASNNPHPFRATLEPRWVVRIARTIRPSFELIRTFEDVGRTPSLSSKDLRHTNDLGPPKESMHAVGRLP